MKRTLSLVLVLAMVFSAMLGVVSFAAEDNTPKALEISQANLEFASAVYLYFAVDYSDFGSADGVTLSVKFGGSEVILKPDSSISAPSNCVAFKYTQLGAQNMGDELVLQALKDGVASGEPKTYSILEYALKAQVNGDEKFTALMDAMLQYGMDAQKAFNHTGDYDLSKKYSLVVPKGGALADGKSKALVALGSSFTVTKDGAAADTIWYNSAVQKLGTGASLSITASKTYYTMFAAPASVETAYAFDMDQYTDAAATVASGQVTVNGYKLGNFILNSGTAGYQPGYVWVKGVSGKVHSVASWGTSQLNKATKAVFDSNNKVFTISVTFAAYGGSGSGVTSLYLRAANTGTAYKDSNGAEFKVNGSVNFLLGKYFDAEKNPITKADYGRFALLQSNKNKITDFMDKGATATNNNGYNTLVTLSSVGTSDGPGEFVTLHLVFDYQNSLLKYYDENGNQLGESIHMPFSETFFRNAYFEQYADSSEGSAFKAIIVTHCNIADYLK